MPFFDFRPANRANYPIPRLGERVVPAPGVKNFKGGIVLKTLVISIAYTCIKAAHFIGTVCVLKRRGGQGVDVSRGGKKLMISIGYKKIN